MAPDLRNTVENASPTPNTQRVRIAARFVKLWKPDARELFEPIRCRQPGGSPDSDDRPPPRLY
jgi:hypothetical protein